MVAQENPKRMEIEGKVSPGLDFPTTKANTKEKQKKETSNKQQQQQKNLRIRKSIRNFL